MSAIGYIRLSIKDQSQYSLEYQEKSIRDYCARNHVEVLEVFQDNGKSSYTFDRPNYIALENFIKKHKRQVEYLIVMDHDRFSRNLSEALTKIDSLQKKYGIKVLATNEPLDLDTSDPSVFMQRAFKYLVANEELFRIRKRVKMGVRHAVESGRFVNFAPFGYKNARDENGKGIIIIEEEKSNIVKKIFADYLDGKQAFVIHNEVKALGFTVNGNSAIVRILGNCVYAGLIRVPAYKNSPERYVTGKHTGIITEADFWLVQQMLGNKRPSKSRAKEEVPLRGILKCTCGLSMTTGWSKGKKQYYLYYRCTKHHSLNISAIELHRDWSEILALLSFSTKQIKYIQDNSKKSIEMALKHIANDIGDKRAALNELETKIERLEEKMMNDEIEPATYKKWFGRYAGDRAYLVSEIQKLNSDQKEKWKKVLELLPVLSDIPGIFEKAEILDQHSLIREVFKHPLVYKDGQCRTPTINPGFAHNYLKIKEKRLLEIEEPPSDLPANPMCTQSGNRTRTPFTGTGF